jgi:hypothetical protein
MPDLESSAHMVDDQVVVRLRQGAVVYLTLTPDGKLLPGPGLSMDDATQKAAEMLAERYAAVFARIRDATVKP